MKNCIRALALILTLAFAATAFAANKVYVNGIDADYPPFAFVGKDGKPTGFDVEALDWIAKEMGFKVEHRPTEWATIVPALTSKKIDIVASGMSITDARKKEIDFSIPYWTITQVLVVKADSALTPETAMVAGKKIGVQAGTSEAKWIKENLLDKGVKKFEMVEYQSSALAIEDVLNGRIAAAAMDDAPAKKAVEQKKAVKIIGQFGMSPEQFGYGMRKEDKDFQAKVNEGLKKLMASPKWKELIEKYKP